MRQKVANLKFPLLLLLLCCGVAEGSNPDQKASTVRELLQVEGRGGVYANSKKPEGALALLFGKTEEVTGEGGH